MSSSPADELARRAEVYAQFRQLVIDFQYPLGAGIDGSVWKTSRPSALKVLEHARTYRNEAECYRRLQEAGVSRIQEFAVPRLIEANEKLLAVEMTIVSPPFLLDFGKVYLDSPPQYWDDAEIMANWHAEGRENFGGRWSKVLSLIGNAAEIRHLVRRSEAGKHHVCQLTGELAASTWLGRP